MTTTTRTALILGGVVLGIVLLGVALLESIEPGGIGETGATAESERKRRGGSGAGGRDVRAGLTGLVRFASDGRPAVGTPVRLAPDSGLPLEAATDRLGRFRFGDLVPGRAHELGIEAEGSAVIRLPGIVLDPGETRDVGVLELAPGVAVIVAIRDPSGRAISGATVEAHVVPDWRGVDWNQRIAQLTAESVPVTSDVTDAEGRVRLDGLPIGTWTFLARKDGFAAGGKAGIDLRPDLADEIVIRLRPGYRLTGRVIDRQGTARPDVRVMAEAPGRFYSRAHASLRERTVSDEEGQFAFEALGAGEQVLYVTTEDWPPHPAAAIRVPEVERIDLVVDFGGRLSGAVLAAENGEPIAGARVRAWLPTTLGGMTIEAMADDAGRYAFARLPSRLVSSLIVEADDWIQASGGAGLPLRVPPAAAIEHDLVMAPGARLSGRVTCEDGPVADATVTVWFFGRGTWPRRRATRTDAEGLYEVTTLSGGATAVEVKKADHYQPDAPRDWSQAMRDRKIPERYRVEVPPEGEATLDIEIARGVPVEGRVETVDGEPVGGARVTLQRASTHSAVDGTFRLVAAPGAGLRVYAAKEGLLTRETPKVDVRPGEPVRDVVLRLGPALSIRGRLTSASGQPLRDARVTLHRNAYRPRRFNVGWSTRASSPVGEDGSYEVLAWATSGRFVIRAEALGHAPATSDPVAIVPGQETYQVDLTLAAGVELVGRVTAEGAPVPGATVGLEAVSRSRGRPRPNEQFPVLAVTDVDGRFRLPHLSAGACGLIVRATGFADGRKGTEVPAKGDLVISLERQVEIRGVVVDVSGSPIAGVKLWTQPLSEDGKMATGGSPYATAHSGADGRFVITELTRRSYRVVAQTPRSGEGPNVQTVQLEAVQAGGEPIRITVEPGGAISGRILDDEGRPVPGANAFARLEGPSSSANRSAAADRDGRFRIVGLAAGPHTLRVSNMAGRVATHQPVTRTGIPSGTEGLEIILPRALAISGHAVDEAGAPLAGRKLQATRLPDPNGTLRAPQGEQVGTVDAMGAFRIPGLSSGRYRLTLMSSRRRMGDQPVLVGGEEVEAGQSGVRLVASQGLTISGAVRSGGRPLPGAYAWAQETGQSSFGPAARADANGRFVLTGLRSGVRYRIRVQARDHREEIREDVLAGATGLLFELVSGRRVSGRLVDAAGKPVPQAYVYFTQGSGNAWGRTDEHGAFDVGGLGEGPARVRVWKPGSSGGAIEVGSVEPGASGVELRLPK